MTNCYWLGYNNSGKLVYLFDTLEEAENYGLKINNKPSYKFCLAQNNSGQDIRLYYETDLLPVKNDNIVNQILFDKGSLISVISENYEYLLKTNICFTTIMFNLIKSMENKKEKSVPKFLDEIKIEALAAAKDGGQYDTNGNSEHYQKQFMEFIRNIERLYGTVMAYMVCISNIDKYAGRAGEKEGVPAEKDLIKKSWYTKASVHFKKKIEAERNGTVAEGRNVFVHMPEEVIDVIIADKAFKDTLVNHYVPLSIAIEK